MPYLVKELWVLFETNFSTVNILKKLLRKRVLHSREPEEGSDSSLMNRGRGDRDGKKCHKLMQGAREKETEVVGGVICCQRHYFASKLSNVTCSPYVIKTTADLSEVI